MAQGNRRQCPKCPGTMHRQSKMCRACSFADEGWKKKLSASRMGQPSYERTPEHKELMSKALMGKPHAYPSGSTRPEVAEKIRDAWTEERREEARERGLDLAADFNWRLSCGRSGPDNAMWRGGAATIPYAPGWTRKTKEGVRQRAGGKCEKCGKPAKLLDTHHKDFAKVNHSEDNLIVLCRKCHKADHAVHDRGHQ